MCHTVVDHGSANRTLKVRTAQGERWHEISARRCTDAVTGQIALLVSEADVSALKRAEAHAHFQALHDALTGLPNRSHAMRRFAAAVQDLDGATQAALVFIDLDHFKDINDTLGHAAGDALLVEMARRLRSTVRAQDLVARLGGDEFLILLFGENIVDEVDLLCLRLAQELAEPVSIQGHDACITPSFGIALHPQDGREFELLLRHADLAMYTAKERGRNAIAYYKVAMSDAVRRRTQLEAELRNAVLHNEFEVHYQPIIETATGAVLAAEALLRWRHPERGLIGPDSFIPLCESTGLIRTLGLQVFTEAARQQVEWARLGFCLRISVNLSAQQLRQPDLLPVLLAALASVEADPRFLQLEITESMLLGNDETVLSQLSGMESAGMTIALDDFGTGYSNLGYLQRFPIRVLKIDRSFVQGLESNRRLAELIVSMCRLMGLSVVAEGVETTKQMAWVRAQGIEQCQGFLIAQPLPPAELTVWLADNPVRGSNSA